MQVVATAATSAPGEPACEAIPVAPLFTDINTSVNLGGVELENMALTTAVLSNSQDKLLLGGSILSGDRAGHSVLT